MRNLAQAIALETAYQRPNLVRLREKGIAISSVSLRLNTIDITGPVDPLLYHYAIRL